MHLVSNFSGQAVSLADGRCGTGDQFSIADLHLAAWLCRIVWLAGGSAGDDGKTTVQKLGEAIGEERVEERRTKIGTYWDQVRERESWKKVYGAVVF
jgi:glutathione S-transferase